MRQQSVEGELIQGHQGNRKEKLVLWKLAWMPDTENCGRISKKDSKNLVCGSSCRWKSSEANKFKTWAIDVLDYLMVHHVRPEDDEALPYAAGYLGRLAKEFMSTWRNDPLNENKKLRSFLNDLRAFCIPTNYKDKLWEEFKSVKQRGRPIQEVANELRQMRFRLPELSATQMYYQLKAAMDMELHSMVTPRIHPQMEWQQMIDLIVR